MGVLGANILIETFANKTASWYKTEERQVAELPSLHWPLPRKRAKVTGCRPLHTFAWRCGTRQTRLNVKNNKFARLFIELLVSTWVFLRQKFLFLFLFFSFYGLQFCVTHLFTRFEDVALERIAIAIPSDVTKYFQVMAVVRYVEYSATQVFKSQ